MKTNYPSFIYNNETFIILPGSRFTKKELTSRLHLIGIDGNYQDKNSLVSLYESSLKDNQNKLKLLPLLRKDTDYTTSQIAKSTRTSLPQSVMSSNTSQNKVMNISYDVQPFGTKEQKISIIKPMNTNKNQYSDNPFFSNNISQNQSNNSFNYNSSNLNNTNNFNKTTDNNHSTYSINQDIYLSKKNDNSIISNNNNTIFNPKVEEQINRNSSNSVNFVNNRMTNNTQFGDSKMNNINQNSSNFTNIGNKQYQEDFRNSNNFMNNKNMSNNTENQRFSYQTNNYGNSRNTNNDNQKSLNEQNQYLKLEQRLPNSEMELSNTQIFNKSNLNASQLNNNDNRKMFTNLPQDNSQYLELGQRIPSSEFDANNYNNYNDSRNMNTGTFNNNYNNEMNRSNYNNQMNQGITIETRKNHNLAKGDEENNEEENIGEYNNIIHREPDEISTFSIFSNLRNLRNYPFYKNRKIILFHLIIVILILCFAICFLSFINNSWDSIVDFFYNFFQLLIDPVRLIQSIGSFFASIFFGAINNLFIIIPLIIACFLGFNYYKKYALKKRIKEIFKKIVRDLSNNSISNQRTISEDDIYQRYLKNEGISYKEFNDKYLPVLRKLRRNENGLKIYNIDGKVFWELPE